MIQHVKNATKFSEINVTIKRALKAFFFINDATYYRMFSFTQQECYNWFLFLNNFFKYDLIFLETCLSQTRRDLHSKFLLNLFKGW